MVLETAGCPTRSCLAAPEKEPVSTTRTSTSIAVNRSMAIPPRNACYRPERPSTIREVRRFKHRNKTNGVHHGVRQPLRRRLRAGRSRHQQTGCSEGGAALAAAKTPPRGGQPSGDSGLFRWAPRRRLWSPGGGLVG